MTPEEIRAAAEVAGEALHIRCVQTARAAIELEMIGEPPLTEAERDALEVGIAAGIAGTFLVLTEEGLLPS